jgi:hypothetical protein
VRSAGSFVVPGESTRCRRQFAVKAAEDIKAHWSRLESLLATTNPNAIPVPTANNTSVSPTIIVSRLFIWILWTMSAITINPALHQSSFFNVVDICVPGVFDSRRPLTDNLAFTWARRGRVPGFRTPKSCPKHQACLART